MTFAFFGRRGLGIASVVAGILAASAASAESDAIRVGIQSVPPDEVYAAKDWGEPYDLDVEITQFSSGGDMLKAFLAGRIDVANGGSGRLATIAAQQPDTFYIIAAHQYGGDRYGVMVDAEADYDAVADLKGKKLGAVTGSGAFATFRVYLDQHGMSVDDLEVVNMKVTDLRAAVQQGIIDAALAWEPHVAIGETMGVVKRIESMKRVNASPNFYLVRRDFAEENPEAVAKFVATLIDVAELIEKDPAEAGGMAAAKISERGVEVDPEALRLAFTRINVDRAVRDELLAELVPIAESMKEANKIPEVPDFDALVNRSFYEQAVDLAATGS